MVLKQYGSNQIDKSDAKIMLENIGITEKSDLSIYKPKIAERLNKILIDDEPVKIEPVEEKTVLKKTKKSKLFKDE
jgi:hypothetical protein